MEKGDKVCLRGREHITGTIIQVRASQTWMHYTEEYLVVYDDQNLCPTQDWHPADYLELVSDLPKGYQSTRLICECGASSVMKSGAKHSDYCPLYGRNW